LITRTGRGDDAARYLGGFFFSALAAGLVPRDSVAAASSKAKPQMTAETVKQVIEKKAGSIQQITFPDTPWSPVRVVRGNSPARDKNARQPGADKAEIAEIVTFADLPARPVRVMRGDIDRGTIMPGQPRRANVMNMQVVTFTNARDRPVSILRGSAPPGADTELFAPASVADLDRVAFAVDGAESSHGADLRMWRPEPSGPQGPMQVTAAAALDVGGGDRYDLADNRALGRAYLARMYRHYGNWPDAVAAYNWGPGNLDAWINGGRGSSKFPLEVERYRDRVLRDAALTEPGIMLTSGNWPFHGIPARAAANDAPLPAVTEALVVDAVRRASTAGDTAIRELIASVRGRAADWERGYLALGRGIASLAVKRPRPAGNLQEEYAVSAEPAD
jgi:Transglycosylase SLT domain